MSDFPYPGLRPFRRNETDIFFGREEQVDQLLDKLEKSRFLAVVGPSGCGKSSLVRAGMLAALETGFLSSAGVRWRIATMHPGNCPMRNFAKALLDESALGPERTRQEDSVAFLLAALRRGPFGLVESLKETPLPQNTNLLILVDQFEEIFRYRQQYSLDEAEAFVALLLTSAEQRGIPLYVVITIRSDFISDCSHFSGLPEVMNESQFLTPCLTREQRSEAIVGPAGVFGGKINPNLVNQLLNDMGTDPDQLPLMQHALMRMWTMAEKGTPFITLKHYESIGGLEKALSNHADEAYDELNEEQKEIARTLFCCLSERAEGKRDTRNPTILSEAAAVAGVKWENVADVAQVFRQADRSFITPSENVPLTPETLIDISHESLIRQWKRLNEWVEEEAASEEIYRRLEQTACFWIDGKAALWSTPDLENALAWRDERHPTLEWARRYGRDFKLAMEFLDESERKREEEKKRESEIRQMELRRTRKRLVLAVIGLIIALCLAGWAALERGKARKAETLALQLEKQRTHTLFNSYFTHALLLLKTEDYQSARATLEKSRLLDSQIPPERRHAVDLMMWYANLMGSMAEKIYKGIKWPLLDIAVSPIHNLLIGAGEKGIIAFFDMEGGQLLKTWHGHTNSVSGVCICPDEKWFVTGGEDHQIVFWTLPKGEKLREWQSPGEVWSMALSPGGHLLAGGGPDNAVSIWDIATGKILQSLRGHEDKIYSLAFCPDGRLLASGSFDNTAIIWDTATGEPIHVLRGHRDDVNELIFHPNGQILVTGGDDEDIRLWDVQSGKSTGVLRGHKPEIYAFTFIHSGRYLVSAGTDYNLRLWDTAHGVTARVLQGNTTTVSRLVSWGDYIFSASLDGSIRRWKIHPPNISQAMRIFDLPGKPNSCAISPDGTKIAIGFIDGAIRLYNLPDLQLVWELKQAHTAEVTRLVVSPDGKSLASVSLDCKLKLWSIEDGRLGRSFSGHGKGIHGVALSPDGKVIATAGLDGRIGFFSIYRETQFYEAHEGKVHSVIFDPYGQHLLSTGEDGRAKLWNVRTWPPLLVWESPKSEFEIYWAAFSPDNTYVAIAGDDTFVHILRTVDGSEDKSLYGHERTIYRVAISPDSRQAVTASGDATIRFWDVPGGIELFALQLPAEKGIPSPLQDFDFHCTHSSPLKKSSCCWIAVPLNCGKLALYNIEGIYSESKEQ